MTDAVSRAPLLASISEVRQWVKDEIQDLIKRHDALLADYPRPLDAMRNAFKSEEGQFILYHIGILSELLVLIKEGD